MLDTFDDDDAFRLPADFQWSRAALPPAPADRARLSALELIQMSEERMQDIITRQELQDQELRRREQALGQRERAAQRVPYWCAATIIAALGSAAIVAAVLGGLHR